MVKTGSSTIKTSIITVIIVGALTALGLGFYFNRQILFDLISANTYNPSPEISAIESKIRLTDNAKTVFHASRPSLEDHEEFNAHCQSHDSEISVLGCYTGGRIYLYDIKTNELTGVVESTAAHELLHAEWERMTPTDKSEISTAINDVYNDPKYHDLLAEDLSTYDESERLEELHSRIGTEIATLPDILERHYAKYFENQDLVVDFYNSYITPFRELSDELDNLSAELERLNQEIEEKTNDYRQRSDKLSSRIDEFNNCATTTGCFATESAFYSRRNELVAEQTALDTLYENLNNLVNRYNSVVAEYNENVLRGETLDQVINSNKAKSEISK